jgi:hypothetical protein
MSPGRAGARRIAMRRDLFDAGRVGYRAAGERGTGMADDTVYDFIVKRISGDVRIHIDSNGYDSNGYSPVRFTPRRPRDGEVPNSLPANRAKGSG